MAMLDDRGPSPGGRGHFRKCRNCGIGLEARARAILPGYVVSRVDTETWRKIEFLWERDNAVTREEPPTPSSEEMADRLRELARLGHSEHALVHFVMETLSCDADDARSIVLAS
jgi:hypothetical protein